MVASVVHSAGARILVLPISAVFGLMTTRLVIGTFGEATYAQYGMLVAFGALLPFTDLGMSAAIVNAVGGSEDPANDDHVRRVLVTSARVLSMSAVVLLAATAVVSAASAWPTLLGDGLLPGSGPLAAALCLVFIALAVPVSIGQRLLTALGKNHVRVWLLGLQAPVVLAVVVLQVRFDLFSGGYVPVIPYVSVFLLSCAMLVIGGRLLGPVVWVALRQAPRIRSVPGTKVSDFAGPMLILMLAVPVAMQTDRLVLSHLAGVTDLARYNLASQLYIPVWQVVSSAGVALWPFYARARAKGTVASHSPFPIMRGFAVAAAVVCLAISVLSGVLVEVASDGDIRLPVSMLVSFSLLMVCQAAKYPLGMFLTDPAGLRFQAGMIVLMVPANLGLSIVLAQHYGAVGPVIGSIVGVLIFEVIANSWFVRRRLAGESPPAAG